LSRGTHRWPASALAGCSPTSSDHVRGSVPRPTGALAPVGEALGHPENRDRIGRGRERVRPFRLMRVLVLGHFDGAGRAAAQALRRGDEAGERRACPGRRFMPLRSVMSAGLRPFFMVLMPCWSGPRPGGDAAFALKAVHCIVPGNPALGLDAHQGLVTLFAANGHRPRMNGTPRRSPEVRTAAFHLGSDPRAVPAGGEERAIPRCRTQARAHLAASFRYASSVGCACKAKNEGEREVSIGQAGDAVQPS